MRTKLDEEAILEEEGTLPASFSFAPTAIVVGSATKRTLEKGNLKSSSSNSDVKAQLEDRIMSGIQKVIHDQIKQVA